LIGTTFHPSAEHVNVFHRRFAVNVSQVAEFAENPKEGSEFYVKFYQPVCIGVASFIELCCLRLVKRVTRLKRKRVAPHTHVWVLHVFPDEAIFRSEALNQPGVVNSILSPLNDSYL
jgi:hypothetical protein